MAKWSNALVCKTSIRRFESGISTEMETLDQYLQNFTQVNDRMYHGGIGDDTFYVTKTD